MSALAPTSDLPGALHDAHGAVTGLAAGVRRLGERHAADHDVLHMSRTLGWKLEETAAALAAACSAAGVELSGPAPDPERTGGPLAPVREATSKLLGSRPPAGALLLADLRGFLGQAADCSVACVIAAQGAAGAKDGDLLAAVTSADDVVQRVHRWALTRLKASAPQVLNGP